MTRRCAELWAFVFNVFRKYGPTRPELLRSGSNSSVGSIKLKKYSSPKGFKKVRWKAERTIQSRLGEGSWSYRCARGMGLLLLPLLEGKTHLGRIIPIYQTLELPTHRSGKLGWLDIEVHRWKPSKVIAIVIKTKNKINI